MDDFQFFGTLMVLLNPGNISLTVNVSGNHLFSSLYRVQVALVPKKATS